MRETAVYFVLNSEVWKPDYPVNDWQVIGLPEGLTIVVMTVVWSTPEHAVVTLKLALQDDPDTPTFFNLEGARLGAKQFVDLCVMRLIGPDLTVVVDLRRSSTLVGHAAILPRSARPSNVSTTTRVAQAINRESISSAPRGRSPAGAGDSLALPACPIGDHLRLLHDSKRANRNQQMRVAPAQTLATDAATDGLAFGALREREPTDRQLESTTSGVRPLVFTLARSITNR